MKTEGENGRILSMPYPSKKKIKIKWDPEIDTHSCIAASFQPDCPHTIEIPYKPT